MTKNSPPLNFALVGCGRIAKRHSELLGLGHIPGARLAAVCDIQEDRARSTGERFKVPWFTDLHDMMKKQSDIDVVVVLTPSGLHAEHALALAPYKKHIVVEKPMALTLADADAMIAACKKNGVQLFVVKQNRFNVPVVRLREELESGRFGRLVMGTVRVRWARDQHYYDQDDWRGTWHLDGGVFTNQASHHVDLLHWMMGDVESVFAKSDTFLVNTETEDTGIAVIRFKSGALGVIEATTACRPKDLEGSLSVMGEAGTVEISGFAVNQMRHWNFVPATQEDQNIVQNYSVNPPNVYGYGHKAYYEHVVDVLNGQATHPVSGDEGRKSLELITAIYESIESKAEVKFPFTPRLSKLGKQQ
ncbi:MAG: Gfo/Idh/MocA family oxidoreductase [Bdellovibrionaceae bacterium]|nr:Gfo/Idh/MocA family oxidoreductase [Pseudobdellovibrionaceae bacterium]